MSFFLSDSFFLFNSFFEGIQMQNLLMIDFLFFIVCLGMMAILVANFPDKPIRFPAILGLFLPVLVTFFPWHILQKNIILGFFGIFMLILIVLIFLSGFQESRSETPSEQKVPNIALTMHFVLYSLVSSGMIFVGLIDATKYNCCHQEIYNYLDNISMFVFGIMLLSLLGIAMRCGSRYEMNIIR